MNRSARAACLAGVAAAAVGFGWWWAERRPYVSPGAGRIYYMDSPLGAMLEFAVVLVVIALGMVSLTGARGALRICAIIAGSYLAGLLAVSLLMPRTIVSMGDSYCWDMWCAGVSHVTASPLGENVVYTAQVSVFADTVQEKKVPVEEARHFFYVVDERGRRFPIQPEASFNAASAVVRAGEKLQSSVTFVAPSSSGRLYLTGDMAAPAWVRLYFGSDLNPFHRRTLLRVL